MSDVYFAINRIRMELATNAAMGSAYEQWSDEYARRSNKTIWKNGTAPLRPRQSDFTITTEQLSTLTPDQLDNLGFARWDDESKLRLIPLYAYNYVADGTVLTSISGDTATKGTDDIDLDVRAGCIAFGVIINH